MSSGTCCRQPFTPRCPYCSSPYSLEVVAHRLLWPVDPVVPAPSEDLVDTLLSMFIIYSNKNRQWLQKGTLFYTLSEMLAPIHSLGLSVPPMEK